MIVTSKVDDLRLAGGQAAARSALEEARGLFEQALVVLEALPETTSTLEQGFEIRLELRRVLNQLGEARQVLRRLREAEALAERLDDDRRRVRVSALLENILALLGDLDGALLTGTRGLESARRLGDLELREMMARAVQNAHYHRGEYERVIDLALENPDPYWLTTSNAHLGRFAEATGHETEAIRLAAATQMDTLGIAQTYYSAASLRLIKGDWTDARARLERAIAACRTGNITLMLSVLVALSAWALVQLDEEREAFTAMRESEPLLERLAASGIVGNLAWAYHALGRGCLGLGRLDEARRLGDRAVELAPNRPGYAAYAQHLLGDIATHPERFDAVRGEAHYGRALALAEPRGMRPLVAHCHLGLGKLYRRLGNPKPAREHLATAATMYREMGMGFYLAQADTVGAGGDP